MRSTALRLVQPSANSHVGRVGLEAARNAVAERRRGGTYFTNGARFLRTAEVQRWLASVDRSFRTPPSERRGMST